METVKVQQRSWQSLTNLAAGLDGIEIEDGESAGAGVEGQWYRRKGRKKNRFAGVIPIQQTKAKTIGLKRWNGCQRSRFKGAQGKGFRVRTRPSFLKEWTEAGRSWLRKRTRSSVDHDLWFLENDFEYLRACTHGSVCQT